MSFESRIVTLKAELIAKHPISKTEEILGLNDEERRLRLISKIQIIAKEIMESISCGQFPAISAIPHAGWGNCYFDKRVKLRETNRTVKRIDFRRRNSRKDFASIVFLLSKSHELLISERRSTRRSYHLYLQELYYENVKLFKSQLQVDLGMRELCNLLNAPSWELRVLAASKGMVAGPAVLTLASGESIDCGRQGGVCIPQDVLQIEKISSTAKWVLIVEKDACFQKLIDGEDSDRLGSCILITGKGYPDVNSRLLVCKFWELLQIPILVLVDADPHGFEIMCVYRFGSASMSSFSGRLACPAVRWLGVHPTDIRPLLLDCKLLSRNDARKIRSLLKRPYVEENENLKAQLRTLLEGNVSAEIEGVASISANYLIDVYVKNKIQCTEYL